MKIVIDTVRGYQLLYIIIEFDYKFSSYCYNVSLLILRSPPLRVLFLFYTILLLHIYPPLVDQIAGVDPYPINPFLKSLGSSCKAENYYSCITSSLMRPKSQLQRIQCGSSSFFLDIIWLSFVLCFQDACPYQQSLLECCPGWQTTHLNLGFAQLMMHSSSDHLPGLL